MRVELFTPTMADLDKLIEVEESAWAIGGEEIKASSKKLANRITTFPSGVTLAMVNGLAVGSQYSFRFDWNGGTETLTTWDDLTHKGWVDKVHDPNGNAGFLVGVGVVPELRGVKMDHNLRWPGPYKISELLIARTLDSLFELGVERVIGCARIPGYHKRPKLLVDEYCSLRENGKLFDPVLRFHERMGARVLKPVPYALDDPESLNAGCWVIYKEKFGG